LALIEAVNKLSAEEPLQVCIGIATGLTKPRIGSHDCIAGKAGVAFTAKAHKRWAFSFGRFALYESGPRCARKIAGGFILEGYPRLRFLAGAELAHSVQ
jgi:hypothetical protein